MTNSDLNIKVSKVICYLFCFLFLFFANAQEQNNKENFKLVELFNEWRDFETPPLKDGVPDYSKNTFDIRFKKYKILRNKLESFSIDSLPVHEQVD